MLMQFAPNNKTPETLNRNLCASERLIVFKRLLLTDSLNIYFASKAVFSNSEIIKKTKTAFTMYLHSNLQTIKSLSCLTSEL